MVGVGWAGSSKLLLDSNIIASDPRKRTQIPSPVAHVSIKGKAQDFPGGPVVKNPPARASLLAQWWRIHMPMQETQVRSLIQEDLTCRGAAQPMHHHYWAHTLEPGLCNKRSHHNGKLMCCNEVPVQPKLHRQKKRGGGVTPHLLICAPLRATSVTRWLGESNWPTWLALLIRPDREEGWTARPREVT